MTRGPVAVLVVALAIVSSPRAQTADPLVQPANIVWEGAFRLPHDNGEGPASFAYGSYALGYDAGRQALYVACHAESHLVGQVGIPPTPSKSTTLTDLPIATRLQPCADLTEGRISQIGGYPKWYIGGLLLAGGRLVASAWSYFDNLDATGATASHFTHNPTTSAAGTVTGPHAFAGFTAPGMSGFVAGYMAAVPPAYQAALGGPALTGQCCIPIAVRSSWGPNAMAFNPADLGATNPVPTTVLVNYPQGQGPVTDWLAASDFYNLSTFMAGMLIPSGTRSLLYVGRQGIGPGSYRGTPPISDPYCGDGLMAPPYQVQVWAYDLNDLAAVKAGTKRPQDVRTYARWPLTGNETATKLPWFNSCLYVRGLAFDPATNRFWIGSFPKAGQMFDGDYPIVHQFAITAGGGTPQPVDCAVSAWSPWGTCDPTTLTQTRTRTVVTPPQNGGAACPVLTETQACTVTPPPPTGTYAVTFASYWGAASNDVIQGVACDGAGNCYLEGGYTGSAFPSTVGTCGPDDGHLTKLSPTGSILWSRCYGGPARDYIHTVLPTAAGRLYVSGVTYGTGYPTTAGAYQTTLRGPKDDFVMELNPSTGAIVWSTLLGGSGEEHDRSVLAVDASGALVIAGATRSTDFPVTPGAVQSSNRGGQDGYVARLSADGRSLLSSTYLGGGGDDALLSGVTVNGDGSITAAGFTSSSNIATTAGALQRTIAGGQDGLVVRLSGALTSIVAATYLGGNATDQISENHGAVWDASGRAVLAGWTQSTNLPVTAGAVQATNRGGIDTFVAILDPMLARLEALTYVGGTLADGQSGVALDSTGQVVVVGETESTDYPLVDAVRATWQQSEMVVTILTPGLDRIVFSSFLGGSGSDRARGVAVSGPRIVVAGDSYSTNIPTTPGAPQSVNRGQRDLVPFVLTPGQTPTPPTCTYTVAPTAVQFPASGGSQAVTVTTGPTCLWAATGGAWVTATPASGTGPGTVTLTAPAYTGTTDRQESATVAGQAVAATQAAPAPPACSVTVAPTALSFPVTGGSQDIQITANRPDCPWTVGALPAWVTASASSGQGSATVTLTAAAWTRSATITIAGQAITVTQP